MNQKFIIMGLMSGLCMATSITVLDNDMRDPMQMQVGDRFIPNTFHTGSAQDTFCIKSHPIYCTENDDGKLYSLCVKNYDYFKSLEKGKVQKFINIEEHSTFGKRNMECQHAENILDLESDIFDLMLHLQSPNPTPHDNHQCILIGHQDEENELTEKIRYYKVLTMDIKTAERVKNKKEFHNFVIPGQSHYDFFSCSDTKKGIEEAEKQYRDYQKPKYKKHSSNTKQDIKEAISSYKSYQQFGLKKKHNNTKKGTEEAEQSHRYYPKPWYQKWGKESNYVWHIAAVILFLILVIVIYSNHQHDQGEEEEDEEESDEIKHQHKIKSTDCVIDIESLENIKAQKKNPAVLKSRLSALETASSLSISFCKDMKAEDIHYAESLCTFSSQKETLSEDAEEKYTKEQIAETIETVTNQSESQPSINANDSLSQITSLKNISKEEEELIQNNLNEKKKKHPQQKKI